MTYSEKQKDYTGEEKSKQKICLEPGVGTNSIIWAYYLLNSLT